MKRSVIIDSFPESAERYPDHTLVAIDVIRATTTAITAVARGRRCYPVPSIEAALPYAARLDQPLLVGELGGNMPYGFDITNSPAEIELRTDTWRSMILLSSSGTQLICNAARAGTAYLACLRNVSAVAEHLATRHARVALIGAGTRGEFREEDQYCCALIAAELMGRGYDGATEATIEITNRWACEPPDAWLGSRSVEYLRRTDQLQDLDFILDHVDDLGTVFQMADGEVVPVLARRSRTSAETAEAPGMADVLAGPVQL